MAFQKTIISLIVTSSVLISCQQKKENTSEEKQNPVQTLDLKELSSSEQKEAYTGAQQALEALKTIQVQAEAQSDNCLRKENPLRAKLEVGFLSPYSIDGDQDTRCPISFNLKTSLDFNQRSMNGLKQKAQFQLTYKIVDPNSAYNFSFRSAEMAGQATIEGLSLNSECQIKITKKISGNYNDAQDQNKKFVLSETSQVSFSKSNLRRCDFSTEQIQSLTTTDIGNFIKKTTLQSIYLEKLKAKVDLLKISNHKKVLRSSILINDQLIDAQSLTQQAAGANND